MAKQNNAAPPPGRKVTRINRLGKIPGVLARGTAVFSAVSKGSSAILDQGFYSGGNFLINIFLARWLSSSEYGAFALSFAGLWFIVMIEQCIVCEPLLVFARGRFSKEVHAYVRYIRIMNRILGLLVAAVLGVIAAGLALSGASSLAWALGGLAVVTVPLYEALLCRRMAFAFGRPELAARGNMAYFFVLVGGIVCAHLIGYLSVFSAFVVLGFAACAVVLTSYSALGTSSAHGGGGANWRRFFFAHLGYGRWALAGGLCAWAQINLALFYLAGSSSLDSAGGYRAVFNLAQPAIQINVALGLLVIPLLVRKMNAKDPYMPLILRVAAGPVGLTVAYGIMLIFLGRPFLHLLYGGEYLGLAGTLWLVAAIPFLASINSILGSVLRAVERPASVFVIRAAGAAVVAAGWLFLPAYNVFSALALTVVGLGMVAILLVAIVFFPHRWRPDRVISRRSS